MSAFTETLTIISSLCGESKISRSGSDRLAKKHTVPAGKAGVVTSVAEGSAVLTLGADHGITSAVKVGVFWDDGQRIDMTVTANNATTITVTVATGTGTAFPIATTAIIVSVQTLKSEVAFSATSMEMLSVKCPQRAGVNFLDDADGSLLAVAIAAPATSEGPGESYSWASDTGNAVPITGTVAAVSLYNGSEVETDVTIGVLIA